MEGDSDSSKCSTYSYVPSMTRIGNIPNNLTTNLTLTPKDATTGEANATKTSDRP